MSLFLDHLRALQAHGEWADSRLLDAVRASDAPQALRELAHVRGAQETWLARIEQRPASLEIWPSLTVDELASVGPALDANWSDFLKRIAEPALTDTVSYQNSAGVAFSAPLGQIVLHMLLHGQYHRGKANAALAGGNGAPVGVDFILWQRQGEQPGK